MSETTLAAAIAAWGLLCFGLGRWCRSLAFVLVAAAPALAIIPHDTVLTDRVDVVEVNDFRDENGRTVFVQVIFYDWCPSYERWQVRAWRLVKSDHELPQRDWDRGGYTAIWLDGEFARRVRADSVRISFTQYDPELCEREVLCKDKRRELSHPTAARPR